MSEQIYFSLYQKVPDYCVRIFQSAHWVLDNGVNLEVNIIGTSHRVISRLGEDCLTEFITCFDQSLPEQALARVFLRPGIVHEREYRSNNLSYRVNVENISQVFSNMKEFTDSLDEISDTLMHEFISDEVDSLRLPFGSVHNFFLNFHQIYIEALYNPFYKIGAPLTSPKFTKKMSLLVSQSEKKMF